MFNIGDTVKVVLPEEFKFHTPVSAYDGKELVISRIAHGQGTSGYSELNGAVSASGLPYGFLNVWLHKA